MTIAGCREYIFSGGASATSHFMASQDSVFVTIGQRVLSLHDARFHYGHPDIFDRSFFIQAGGLSKASKGINLSEDIFSGMNNFLRGGRTIQIDYFEVGRYKYMDPLMMDIDSEWSAYALFSIIFVYISLSGPRLM